MVKMFLEDNKSFYQYDLRARDIISSFADKYFYPNLLRNHEVVIRSKDKAKHVKGVDLTIHNWWNRKSTRVCEKTSSHYINSELSNFAFEIGTGRNLGWFIREENETDVYSIIWVRADRARYPMTRYANNYFISFQEMDIEYMLACLIRKEALFSYLASAGLARQDLLDKANEMAAKKQERDNSYRGKYGFWFVYSKDLYESPVNLIIGKDVLSKLSVIDGVAHCYRFSTEKMERLDRLP